MDYYKHETALVSAESIGKGTRIWAFVNIMPDVSIGENCNICDHVFIESGVRIGNGVTIKNGVSIWTGLTIEDGVFIGPNVCFTNDLYPRSQTAYKHDLVLDKILLCKGASIGGNATILPNVTIGQYSIIGAGSVVVQDVPPYTIVKGNPAQFTNHVCVCTKILHFNDSQSECSCGRKYIRYDRYKMLPLIVFHNCIR